MGKGRAPINPEYWRILQRETSAFSTDTFDRSDYVALLAFSESISRMEQGQITAYGRSLTADSYYALSGCDVDHADPMGGIWSSMRTDPAFASLQRQFKAGGEVEKALMVMNMASKVEGQLVDLGQKVSDAMEQGDMGAEEAMLMLDADLLDSEALEGIGEEVENKAEMISGVLWSLGGSPPQRFEAALELTSHYDLSDFADILGWVKRIVSGATRKSEGGNEVFTRYKSSPLSERVLPRQLLGLIQGDPATMSAAADDALTTRVYSSSEPEGKGPVILLRDESSSMLASHSSNGRTWHERAQIFEFALAQAFHRENREMIVIRWSTRTAAPFVYGEGDVKQHLAGFLGGGTDPREAMAKAVDIALDYVPGADLLVLSDALFPSSYLGDDQLAEFRAEQGRVWAIVFGQERMGEAAEEHLDSTLSWADGWTYDSSLELGGKGKGMERVLERMATRRPSASTSKVR